MNFKLFDLYSDYLLSSFSATTATGMSALMDKAISHDQISRMLNGQQLEPADWWQIVKPSVRTMQGAEGVITIDDSIVEKPYTDENELICWHYDHGKQGWSRASTLSLVHSRRTGDLSMVSKESFDKQGKRKRRSSVTKNEHFRCCQNCVHNRIRVLNDIWFASRT